MNEIFHRVSVRKFEQKPVEQVSKCHTYAGCAANTPVLIVPVCRNMSRPT